MPAYTTKEPSQSTYFIPEDFVSKLVPDWHGTAQGVDLGTPGRRDGKLNKQSHPSILESRNFRNLWLNKIKLVSLKPKLLGSFYANGPP